MNNRDILDSIKKYNEMSLEDYFSCSDDVLLKVITPFEEVNYIGDLMNVRKSSVIIYMVHLMMMIILQRFLILRAALLYRL